MSCYKLNIFEDSRETYTDSALNPFLRMNPIYVIISDTQKDEYKSVIHETIAKCIVGKNDQRMMENNCDLDFRVLDYRYGIFEDEVVIKNNIISIVNFLQNNKISIFGW